MTYCDENVDEGNDCCLHDMVAICAMIDFSMEYLK